MEALGIFWARSWGPLHGWPPRSLPQRPPLIVFLSRHPSLLFFLFFFSSSCIVLLVLLFFVSNLFFLIVLPFSVFHVFLSYFSFLFSSFYSSVFLLFCSSFNFISIPPFFHYVRLSFQFLIQSVLGFRLHTAVFVWSISLVPDSFSLHCLTPLPICILSYVSHARS